jgi:hypothetical protein
LSTATSVFGERDFHIGRPVHHVVVRQNVAFRADNHAGTESLLMAILGHFHATLAEKLAEHRIHLQLLHTFGAGFDDFG